MSSPNTNPWLHRLAWLTAVVALLPISFGAVVTTLDAGMAFPDWLTADGVFVPLYPWLKATGDKFVEHGHRLAVIVEGVLLLLMTGVVFSRPSRRDVRLVTGLIVLGYLGQAVLGGQRVIRDERVLALLHGDFAACVFAVMGLLVAMTGPRWTTERMAVEPSRATAAFAWGLVALATLSVQYVLGGMLRHFGAAHAWLAHPWFAIAVAASAIAFLVAAIRTGSFELRRTGAWVLGLVVAQALLGVVTWGVRYGFPQWDIVAVQQSSLQVAIRSLHKVLGLVTFMAVFVSVVRTARAAGVGEKVFGTLGSVPDTGFAGGPA